MKESNSDVYKAVSTLQLNKAEGCHGINPSILKLCVSRLLIPITSIFLKNHSYASEIKYVLYSKVETNQADVKYYCPISLLCMLSKILESLSFIPFIRPLISVHQLGFMKNRSCQLLCCFSHIFDPVDKGIPTDALYFDFKQAFDTVSHAKLLFKFWKMGITGTLWFWFKVYLENRRHFVSFEGSSSNLLPVISGQYTRFIVS